jgi:hypothetical protein
LIIFSINSIILVLVLVSAQSYLQLTEQLHLLRFSFAF